MLSASILLSSRFSSKDQSLPACVQYIRACGRVGFMGRQGAVPCYIVIICGVLPLWDSRGFEAGLGQVCDLSVPEQA